MGTYLSTPVTEKHHEQSKEPLNADARLSWAVIDMQGWRKSMEDSHVAQHVGLSDHSGGDPDDKNENADPSASPPSQWVFGVFDGHGGPEVARFCQVYLVNALLRQQEQLQRHSGAENSTGTALINTFHALDRMIDDPERRNELIRLRAIQPMPGEQRAVPPLVLPSESLKGEEAEKEQRQPESIVRLATGESTCTSSRGTTDQLNQGPAQSPSRSETETRQQEEEQVVSATLISDAADTLAETFTAEQQEDSAPPHKVEDDDGDSSSSDDDSHKSDELVSHDEELEQDRKEFASSSEEDQSSGEESDADLLLSGSTTSEKFRVMFQRLLLQMSTSPTQQSSSSGQVVVEVKQDSASIEQTDHSVSMTTSTALTTTTQEASALSAVSSPSLLSSTTTTTTTVRKTVCTLPDHPIHAGATAIVAVLSQPDNLLTVANAGDSRAVLCRRLRPPTSDTAVAELTSLLAIPLSHDHKPQLATERNRIERAGGFVNQFGRVNGNLNLSRSIGDLKYKQDTSIPPADQIISAQPDIIQMQVEPEDEFLLLGCDGIWDCVDNEQAVNYVASRIDTMSLVDIGKKLLDDIISVDPRATQGIGGDNMTIMIVDLQPHSRSYRKVVRAQLSLD